MRRRSVVGTVILVTWILMQGTATAGGGWWTSIDLKSSHWAVGETIQVKVDVWFETVSALQAAIDGRFRAYLLADVDFPPVEEAMSEPDASHWWRLGEATAIELDEVFFDREAWGDMSNVVTARADFVVPEVQPGKYALMLCDEGCHQPLGDVFPTTVTVYADAATAGLARRLEGVESDLAVLAEEHPQAQQAKKIAAGAWGRVAELQANLRGLEQSIEELEAAPAAAGDRPSTPWASFIGWFLAGVASAMLVLVKMARRDRSVPSDMLSGRERGHHRWDWGRGVWAGASPGPGGGEGGHRVPGGGAGAGRRREGRGDPGPGFRVGHARVDRRDVERACRRGFGRRVRDRALRRSGRDLQVDQRRPQA
jgi:hypothetical protein